MLCFPARLRAIITPELVKLQQKVLEQDYCNNYSHHDPYRRALKRNKLLISNIHRFHSFYKVENQVDADECRLNHEEIHLRTYFDLCMLVVAEEDRRVSSHLALLDSEIVRFIYSVICRSQEVYVLTQVLNHFYMRFGVWGIGVKFSEDALKRLWKIVMEHGRALERAEDVGNGAENV